MAEDVGVSADTGAGDGANNKAQEFIPFIPTEVAALSEDDGWLDVLGSGRLRMKVKTPGKGAKPPKGCLVKAKWKCCLLTGDFVTEKTESFIISDGDTLKCIDMCSALMTLNEVVVVKCAPIFAFEQAGFPPLVKSDTWVEFEIHLLAIDNKFEIHEQSPAKQIELVLQKKDRGNQLFQYEDFTGAINSYSKGIKFLEESLLDEAHVTQRRELLVVLYSNQAAAQIKMKAFKQAVESCDEALEIEPGHMKSLYRKGKALCEVGEFLKAQSVLQEAIEMNESSSLLKNELAKVRQKMREENTEITRLYRKMFPAKLREPIKKKWHAEIMERVINYSTSKYICISFSVVLFSLIVSFLVPYIVYASRASYD